MSYYQLVIKTLLKMICLKPPLRKTRSQLVLKHVAEISANNAVVNVVVDIYVYKATPDLTKPAMLLTKHKKIVSR